MPEVMHSTAVGVENLVFATLTDDTLMTYGTVTKISPLINVKVTPKITSTSLYADNMAVENVTSLGDIDVEFETQDLPLEVQAALLGHTLDLVGGVMTYKSSDLAPYVALGFKIKKGNGKYRYVWLLKGRFEDLSEEAATQDAATKFTTPKLKGTFIPRLIDGLWKYVMDEDSATTPITTFLTTVYKPVLV